ncbi:dTDP-4-dehydrorhamnose reductase [Luminiphilus sp.]|nr:dTDP-4-dehydrorhamnose reductase [Luminiphilus sp.]
MKRRMRIVIIGSGGQVGRELVRLDWSSFLDGFDVEIVSFTRAKLDVTSEAAVRETLSEAKPGWVINASAYTAVDKAESDSVAAYSVNAVGPEILARYCNELGAKLIHISTDYVYPGEGSAPLTEDDAVGPRGVYGASKLAGELLVSRACPEHIILRTAWVYGASGGNFVKTMLRLGADREKLTVVSDQWGGPTSAVGIAGAIASIVGVVTDRHARGEDLSHLWGTYNFSGEPHVNWAQFAQAIFNEAVSMGLMSSEPVIASITTEQYPTAAKRPFNSRLSNQKIADVFGVQPDDWKASLKDMLVELREERGE